MDRATAQDVIDGKSPWSVVHEEGRRFLAWLPRDSVQLVFGSPPYALKAGRYPGLVPGAAPNDPTAWAAWMHCMTAEASHCCSGFICWVVDSPRKGNGEYVPAVEQLMGRIAGDSHLVLCTPHVWTKNSPPGGSKYPGHAYEIVVVCHRRGAAPHYNPGEIATATKYNSGAFRQRAADGERIVTDRKTKKGAPARPRDVVHVTVGGGHMGREKPDGKVDRADDKLACSGEAPFPWRLARRFVRGMSLPGDIVCDPFSGTGTTALAAVMHGRRFVGCDLDPSKLELIDRRMRLLDEMPTGAVS